MDRNDVARGVRVERDGKVFSVFAKKEVGGINCDFLEKYCNIVMESLIYYA